ncbi:MAG: phosphoribosylglycinamide formyltransferase [Brockia lithotrophica]|nr:phosphoribosylglycinamide formyltransferase [Brockia lithotrophica]
MSAEEHADRLEIPPEWRPGAEPVPVAVFASGEGSNAVQLVRREGVYRVVALVSDRPEAPVVRKFRRLGREVFARSVRDFPDKAAFEEAILAFLKPFAPRWLVLAGYMRLVGPTLLGAYPWRILNLHPALLPAFPGKDAVGQALAYGVKVTGTTVHLVDQGVDTGPIVAQRSVDVRPTDTPKTLAARIKRVEHRLYPAVLSRILREGLVLEGRRVRFLQEGELGV